MEKYAGIQRIVQSSSKRATSDPYTIYNIGNAYQFIIDVINGAPGWTAEKAPRQPGFYYYPTIKVTSPSGETRFFNMVDFSKALLWVREVNPQYIVRHPVLGQHKSTTLVMKLETLNKDAILGVKRVQKVLDEELALLDEVEVEEVNSALGKMREGIAVVTQLLHTLQQKFPR